MFCNTSASGLGVAVLHRKHIDVLVAVGSQSRSFIMLAICSIRSLGAVTITAEMRPSATAETMGGPFLICGRWSCARARRVGHHLPEEPTGTAATRAAAKTDGRLRIVTRGAAGENAGEFRPRRSVGVFEAEHPDFGFPPRRCRPRL